MKTTSFNPVAEAYTNTVSPRRFNQFLALTHALNLKGTERILDIGSGPGILSMHIARELTDGGSLLGIDLSPNMVELSQKNLERENFSNVTFKLGNALDLNLDAGEFDIVVSSNAYPWVPDRKQFLSEVNRVLKPNGKLALVALSTDCYQEFSNVLRGISQDYPGLFPDGEPFEIMGAKLHTLSELSESVANAGFKVENNFTLSTVEPIKPIGYVERINAIVNENYLDHFVNEKNKTKTKKMIIDHLASRNGSLTITESSVFVIANK